MIKEEYRNPLIHGNDKAMVRIYSQHKELNGVQPSEKSSPALSRIAIKAAEGDSRSKDYQKSHERAAYSAFLLDADRNVSSLIVDANVAGHDVTLGGEYYPAYPSKGK